MSWSFAKIWNESLEEGRPQRPIEPREKIWASELGGSMVDRYLKMKGIVPTNPPNPRSLRKFEAGNIWEAIIGYVLRRAGVLLDAQELVQYQYDGLLPVSGKLDYLAGGKPDYEKSIKVLDEFSWLPEFISRATKQIIVRLQEEYPNGLEEIILEIKSCSSFMFERYEATQDASSQHKLQTFHYLKSKSMKTGHIVYVCKDDARLSEAGVLNPSPIEAEYKGDIERMTGFIRAKERPPLELPIVFDKDWGKFSANWKVGYSNYLTLLYGLENQKAFDDKYKPTVERWNRVLGRIADRKDMTANNLEAVAEMEKQGFKFDEIKPFIKKVIDGDTGSD